MRCSSSPCAGKRRAIRGPHRLFRVLRVLFEVLNRFRLSSLLTSPHKNAARALNRVPEKTLKTLKSLFWWLCAAKQADAQTEAQDQTQSHNSSDDPMWRAMSPQLEDDLDYFQRHDVQPILQRLAHAAQRHMHLSWVRRRIVRTDDPKSASGTLERLYGTHGGVPPGPTLTAPSASPM